MDTNKSLMSKVLSINITLMVLHIVLFTTLSLFYTNQLIKERHNVTNVTLEKMNRDFQLEVHRLDSLMLLCLNDPSLVFAISDRLDNQFFLNNADEAAKKLMIIKRALPYAKQVFLYSRLSDRVVIDSGAIFTKEHFTEKMVQRNSEYNMSISELTDGLYKFGNQALFIKNLYKQGFIAVQINLEEFANINSNLKENHYAYILDSNNNILIENACLPLTRDTIAKAITKPSIKINGTTYYCKIQEMTVQPYKGLLLINSSVLLTPLPYILLVGIITLSILLVSCILLIYLNIKIYLPLRNFTSKYGNLNGSNEISFIENKIHDLLYEIYTLSEQESSKSAILPEKITLHYLMYGGCQISNLHLAPLRNKYTFYSILAFIVQNDNGEPDALFALSLEKKLAETYMIQSISLDKFTNAFLIKPEDKNNIITEITNFAMEDKYKNQIFIGATDCCSDILALNSEYQLAYNKLMATKINFHSNVNYDEYATVPYKTSLNLDLQNRIYEYIRNGAYDLLEKTIKQIFYEHESITLSTYINYYQELDRIIERTCMAMKLPEIDHGVVQPLYNTRFMYELLQSQITQIKILSQTPNEMRDRIITYINLHLPTDLTLDIVADEFSITPVYLSSWFKKNMKINFSSYVSYLRMEKAIQILNSEQCPKISVIAKQIGIDNPATFIRQFKHHTGTTPAQYRKNMISGDAISEP